MSAGSHCGPKITFDHFSHHFRSIHNFSFFWIFFHKFPFWMTENQFRFWKTENNLDRTYRHFVTKCPPAGHFGPKMTFDCISCHFRSIHNFFYWTNFTTNFTKKISQMASAGPFWMTENHFWSHFSPFQINTLLYYFGNLSQNVHRRPFWMTENHFRLYFSPFQINTLPLFFRKFCHKMSRRPFWTENDFRLHFPPFFWTKIHKTGVGRHFGWPKITFDRISCHFRSIRNFKFFEFFFKMAASGHFGCPIFAKIDRDLSL